MYLYRKIGWLDTYDVSGADMVIWVPLGLLVAPAVGGLVVVGQMISHYGTCTQIG